MKKITALLLALMMLAGVLAGCGKPKDTGKAGACNGEKAHACSKTETIERWEKCHRSGKSFSPLMIQVTDDKTNDQRDNACHDRGDREFSDPCCSKRNHREKRAVI